MNSPVRLVAALAVFIIGLAIVGAIGGSTGQIAIIAVAGLISGALLATAKHDEAPITIRKSEADEAAQSTATEALPVQQWLTHPAFGSVMDPQETPILVVSDGLVQYANPSALTLLGRHVIGQDVRTAIRHPAAAEMLANPAQSAIGSKTTIVGLGAREQRWQLQTIPLSATQTIAMLSDLSALESVGRMRTDFVANASHELRTPLAAILGFVETLRDPDAGEDAAIRERFLGVMDKEAKRMRQLVDDLISLSRIEADRYRAPSEELNFGQLVREVTHDVQESGNRSNSTFHITIGDDVPLILGDRVQLAQLLHNIIGNAVKYNRDGRAVTIAVENETDEKSNMILLTVQDEGEGIPAEHLPRLTERFYRVDSARSRAIGGTGLGLSIVKHIVERHRGRLAIESKTGEGTTVKIQLPRAD